MRTLRCVLVPVPSRSSTVRRRVGGRAPPRSTRRRPARSSARGRRCSVRATLSFATRQFSLSVRTGDAVYNPPAPVPDVAIVYYDPRELIASRDASGPCASRRELRSSDPH